MRCRRQSFLGITVALLFASITSANAACSCLSVGGGFCVPDASCYSKMDFDIKNAVKNAGSKSQATRDVGKVVAEYSKFRILETGYKQLQDLGKEGPGYGLYSYAVLIGDSARSAALLTEIFKAIPQVEDTAASRSQTNIFYIPTKSDSPDAFANLIRTSGSDKAKLGAEVSRDLYSYQLARAILNHVCNPPADSMKGLCQGPMDDGPYIFTYAKPASGLEPVPPPFLFFDLSGKPLEAFPEYISAFKEQVKREDMSDGARLHTFRLSFLDVALKAAHLVNPVEDEVARVASMIHDSGVPHDAPKEK